MRSSKVQRFVPAVQWNPTPVSNGYGTEIVLAANVWTLVSLTFTVPTGVGLAGPYLYSVAGVSYSLCANGDPRR